MSSNLPPELKFATQFLMRAKELQAREPIIAYYCKVYVVKQALEKGLTANPQCKSTILGLMNELEKEKSFIVGVNKEALTNDTVAAAIIEDFALKVFLKADNQDRSNIHTKKTAMVYLAAATFLETLGNFGMIDMEITEKIKYAKWRATEIVKAEKEGRAPASVDTSDPFGIEPISAGAPAPVIIHPPQNDIPYHAPPVHDIFPPKIPDAIPPADLKGVAALASATEQAQKCAKNAIAALQYDDMNHAIKELEKALDLIRPYRR